MEEQRTGTILEYARTQTRDFTEYPFQTADALVFALLSYDRIPQSVPRLKTLVARYGSLSRRVRSFDWRHPVASAQAIVRVPFDGPTMRQVEQELTLYEEHHPYLEEHAGFIPAGTPRQFYRSIAHNPRFAVTRINAAAHMNDMSYSKLIGGLKKADIDINRKMLSEMAVADPAAFAALCETAKKFN